MNRLWVRLSLIFGGFVLISALIVLAGARLLVNERVINSALTEYRRGFNDLADHLGRHYKRNKNWDDVDSLMEGAQAMTFLWPGPRPLLILVDEDDNIVYPPQWRNRDISADEARFRRRIEVDGKTIAHLVVRPNIRAELSNARLLDNNATNTERANRRPPGPLGPPGPPFGIVLGPGDATPGRTVLENLSWLLLIIALIGGSGGILVAVFASRGLTSPLQRLSTAARAIAGGDMSQRVQIEGSQEMQEVGVAFNEMMTSLEEAEKLRRNLVADVAHELRTPLSVLQGNLRAILDDVYPLDKREIARLYTQTRLLNRLVNDLREVAQAEAGQLPLNFQSTNLASVVHEVVENFAPFAEAEEVHMAVTFPADLPSVNIDVTRFKQVLNNLLANAVRHSDADGTVMVSGQATVNDIGDTILRLTVQDTGDGIAPQHLKRIFDRFYRFNEARDRESGGTGLGLAIVQAIVQAHGGQVGVHSDGLGQGTTFWIELPTKEQPLFYNPDLI